MSLRVLAASLLLLAATPLHAAQAEPRQSQDGSEPAAEAKAGKVLRAFRITGTPPVIDGRLDDEAWLFADTIDEFVQWEPVNMVPLSERTVAQVAYDDRYIYVALRCYDSEPSRIVTGLARRDNPPLSDTIGVGFDPRHDHLTGYVFATNPSGVQTDASYFDDVQTDRDYNGVWEVRTQVSDEGWMAEFQIPFSQMRFALPAAGEVVWGFSVRRTIQRKGELGEWTGRPRGEQGNVSRWGHLVFGDQPSPPRRVELLPYTLASTTQFPAATGADHAGGAGLDLRLGLGTAATLSATVNPDFGQVEQDPAVLNLTVFETFFPEKRPFFLEDARTFVPPQFLFQLFHSRRTSSAVAQPF